MIFREYRHNIPPPVSYHTRAEIWSDNKSHEKHFQRVIKKIERLISHVTSVSH